MSAPLRPNSRAMIATAPSSSSAAYQANAVLTATPERLVVMLYDGAARFLAHAERAIAQGDMATANMRLQRAEAIIDELDVTLDHSAGEIAANLSELYRFCRSHLTKARLRRD